MVITNSSSQMYWCMYVFFFSVGVCPSILWSSSSMCSGQFKFERSSYRYDDKASHYFPYCSEKWKGLWTSHSSQVASRYVFLFNTKVISTRLLYLKKIRFRPGFLLYLAICMYLKVVLNSLSYSLQDAQYQYVTLGRNYTCAISRFFYGEFLL